MERDQRQQARAEAGAACQRAEAEEEALQQAEAAAQEEAARQRAEAEEEALQQAEEEARQQEGEARQQAEEARHQVQRLRVREAPTAAEQLAEQQLKYLRKKMQAELLKEINAVGKFLSNGENSGKILRALKLAIADQINAGWIDPPPVIRFIQT